MGEEMGAAEGGRGGLIPGGEGEGIRCDDGGWGGGTRAVERGMRAKERGRGKKGTEGWERMDGERSGGRTGTGGMRKRKGW